MFQFQTGAIKSKKKTEAATALKEFQFQTGAIKSRCGYISRLPDNHRFNSKLVRLKVLVRERCYRELVLVSIPNWCD